MPTIDLDLSPNGPILVARIGVSLPWRLALSVAGEPAPPEMRGFFVLDTGASTTSVDEAFLAPLGLHATGTLLTHTTSTAGTPVSCTTYDVSLTIPGQRPTDRPLSITALSVSKSHFRGQGIDGLIGRDVLSRCIFGYDGIKGTFSLAY